jgi:hypothetical protein
MTAGSGRQCSMWLSESSPLGAFSKILLGSSHWGSSREYCYVWNRLDTKFALSAFQLTPLGQSTLDTGYSLWRTPQASDPNGGGSDGEKRLAKGNAMKLRDQAKTPKLWPTPQKEGYDAQGKGHGDLVYEVKARLWPTPQAHDAAKGNPERVGRFGTKHGGRNLTDEVLLPSLSETFQGSLNPRFVEQLMGFEIDHTALKLLATVSSPSKHIRSSKRSRKSVFAL